MIVRRSRRPRPVRTAALVVLLSACGTEEPAARVDDVVDPYASSPPALPPPVLLPPSEGPSDSARGFLEVPDIVPAQIPPPGDVSRSPVDGMPIVGVPPRASAPAPAPDLDPRTPSFTPFTVAPTVRNPDEAAAAVEREYPPLLRDAGVGGRAEVWIHIDREGVVRNVQINRSSGHPALDEAAMKVARAMRFTPAKNRDRVVEVWISIPIAFRPGPG